MKVLVCHLEAAEECWSIRSADLGLNQLRFSLLLSYFMDVAPFFSYSQNKMKCTKTKCSIATQYNQPYYPPHD